MVPTEQFRPNSVEVMEAIVDGTTGCDVAISVKAGVVAGTRKNVYLFSEDVEKKTT